MYLLLSYNIASNITNEMILASLMEAFTHIYEKSSMTIKVHLKHILFNLRMAECASMINNLNEFNTVTTQLTFVSINFNDEGRALIFFFIRELEWYHHCS